MPGPAARPREAVVERHAALEGLDGFPVALRRHQRQAEVATRRYVSPASLGLVYLALGDRATALEYLQRGYDDRSWWMIFLKVDPRFDDLRGEPAFQELVARVGLQ